MFSINVDGWTTSPFPHGELWAPTGPVVVVRVCVNPRCVAGDNGSDVRTPWSDSSFPPRNLARVIDVPSVSQQLMCDSPGHKPTQDRGTPRRGPGEDHAAQGRVMCGRRVETTASGVGFELCDIWTKGFIFLTLSSSIFEVL